MTTTTEIISANNVKTKFSVILRRTKERGERFIVNERGEPQAVLLSVEDYLTNVVKQPKSLAALQRTAKKRGLDTMSSAEIDREIRRIRKHARGH